jgi:hypothetical protein
MAQTVITETNLIKSNFTYDNLVTCPAGKYTELVIKEVEIEQRIWFGYGDKNPIKIDKF